MQSYRSILQSVVCVGAVSLGAMALPAQGSVIALEQFDYTAGTDNLGTFNGGTGWSGGWKNDGALTVSSTADVQASSLAAPTGYLGTPAGGSVIETSVLAYRALASDIHFDIDQDYYVSLLTRRSGTAKSMSVQFMSSATNTVASFGNSTGGTLFVGGIGSNVNGAGPRIGTGATPQDSNTFLWVFKISAKQTGNDQFYLKTYKVGGAESVGTTEPTSWEVTGNAGASNSTVANRIGIVTGSGQTLEFDEIRIGTTWQDVAAVPEPASMSLLGLAGVALLGRRRGKA